MACRINTYTNKEHQFTTIALLDSGANMNCIQGIIPTKYFKKLSQASGAKLNINYKLPNAHICNIEICFKTLYSCKKNTTSKVILGNPFLALLYPFQILDKGITTNVLGQEVTFKFLMSPFSKEINLLKRNLCLTKYKYYYKGKNY
jgi:hypothetical protein